MLNGPFSPWPSFTQEEADAVSRVLLSNRVNYWTGQEGREFECEFAAWCGVEHAIAVANGTVALDLALAGLSVGARNGGSPGDEVVVTPRTFVASASTVPNAGAVPVFADVDPESGNITAETIAAVLSENTKAIIAVHLAGWPCDMDPIMELAAARGIKVIEDCAQAHGAFYKGRPVGAIGHVAAWSFCQDKIMTTGGEGGMVTTVDRDLWSRMWALKDHGKSWGAVYERQHPPGFRWLHESFGTNWRMTEMQAAIGRIQLMRMADWTAARTASARIIENALAPFAGESGPVRVPNLRCAGCEGCKAQDGCVHAYYKYYVYVRPGNLAPGWDRDRIVEEIKALGVPCFQGSCSEVYLEKAFAETGWRPKERLPVARELGDTSVMLLVHPTLTEGEITKTAEALRKVLEQARRT
ncbi:dTDP-4-amino-4,6-dideoxygalactose transaminase [Roseovarius litoreus]|uniref:dTDP-4-amino-4,6-dideoxygalactose transaminase n=1 Tax=Roseovarius litoreus TaxID=1155722 RepID=A0A1M7KXI1_9RHOB|nr:DegT/DnrJ/EryC1/StrS aminotransferase family protein [Roseovarius litoreus]SHM70196.1 dTDP-4-amino-4,6-dideoxygalactose transaminase [Roseovarius litoreus]